MTNPDPQSVLESLGIDPNVPGVEPQGDAWLAMLDTAVDPNTGPADTALVPVMDDEQSYPDDDSDGVPADAGDHHADSDGHHEHDVAPDPSAHPDPADAHTDAGGDSHQETDHHSGDTNHHDPGPWHE